MGKNSLSNYRFNCERIIINCRKRWWKNIKV